MWPELGAAVGGAVVAAGIFHPRVPLFGPVKWHGSRKRRIVALSFDDGPHPDHTLTIAHILESRWKKGTFFCVGEQALAYPDTVKALAAAGHDVENHTHSHGTTRHLFSARLLTEDVGRAQQALQSLTGRAPTLYRPAVGIRNPAVHAAARAHRLQVVTWSASARDGAIPLTAARAQRLAEQARPGDILALHDGARGRSDSFRKATVENLPVLLDGLLARGFDLAPVSALLKAS
jgi:peptidoglycan-N-acetylglucosamine deacetylase